jgi:two-component system, sensor histidine kinase YesM
MSRGRSKITSFRTQLIYTLIPMILIPVLAISFISYRISFTSLQKRSMDDVWKISTLANENLNLLFESVDRLACSILYERNIQRIISDYQENKPYVEPTDNTMVQGFLEKLLVENGNLRSIFIYTKGNTVFSQSLFGDLPSIDWKNAVWYRLALNTRDHSIIIPTHAIVSTQSSSNKSKYTFSIARQIKETNNFNVIGVIVLNLDISSINSIITISQVDSQTKFLIFDDQGNWIYPGDESAFPRCSSTIDALQETISSHARQIKLDGEVYYLASNHSTVSGWTVVAFVPEGSIADELRSIMWLTLLVTVAILTVMLALFFYLAAAISHPVTQMRKMMKTVEEGNLDINYLSNGTGELDELGRVFARMTIHLKKVIEENLQAQIQCKTAELAALQNQLNPHFIYNTLESFQMIAITEGSTRLARMSYSLGQLMRIALDVKECTSLDQELEHTENYLLLIRERYEDRLQYEISVSETLLQYGIPKLTLQPLVENAVYHGIDKSTDNGFVKIGVTQEHDDIVITVRDNGIGIAPDVLDGIMEELRKEENTLYKKHGIGLVNIQSRLRRLYGDGYRIDIQSELNIGTTVTVTIPMRLLDSEGD